MAIDIDQSHYNTGTATVVGSAVVGQGTTFTVLRKGDLYGTHRGAGVRIADIADDTHLTLAYDVPALYQDEAPYEVQRTPYDLGYLQAIEDIVELMGNGLLPALAPLDGTGGDKLIRLTGPQTADVIDGKRVVAIAQSTGAGVIELATNGAVTLVPKTDLVSGVDYDKQVDDLPARAVYDPQIEGFSVLISNMGDGRAAITSRVTSTAGVWSDPAYVTGPAITLDITEVDEVPYGVPPGVTLTPVAGGYNLKFDIPAGMIIVPGTTTTLASDQDAEVTFVPITGGYRIDIAIPRGATGDIAGVTTFWQGRITNDADASAALTGLGFSGFIKTLIDDADGAAARTTLGANDAANLTAGTLPDARVSATLAADKALRRGNILGAVAQAGGVPTGALVESGSNANGSYVRFADGTQICYTSQLIFLDTNLFQAVTLPAAFAANSFPKTNISFALSASSGTDAAWRQGVKSLMPYTTTNGANYLIDSGTFSASGIVHGLHIGRWF